MKKILASFASFVLLASPLTTLAAPNPSDIIKDKIFSGLMNQTDRPAMGADFDMSLKSVTKKLKKSALGETVEVQLHLGEDVYPIFDSWAKNVAMSYDVSHLKIDTQGFQYDQDHPLTLDFKLANDKTIYVRLVAIDPVAKAMVKSFTNVDLDPIIGQWVKFDLGAIVSKLDRRSADVLAHPDEEHDRLVAWFTETSKKLGSPVILTRAGKAQADANGDLIQNYKVTINPRWYAAVEKMTNDEFSRTHFDATAREKLAAKKETTKMFLEFRKQLAKIKMTMSLNLTKADLDSFGASFHSVDLTYTYDYSYNAKTKKYNNKKIVDGKTTTDAKGLIKFRDASEPSFVEPATSLDKDAAWKLIYTAPTSSTYAPLLEP